MKMRSLGLLAAWCSFSTAPATRIFTERDGRIDSREITQLAVFPDTHGDIEAAISSLYLAYEKLVGNTAAIGLRPFWEICIDAIYNDILPANGPIADIPGMGLIQLGDLIDRGPYSQNCVRLFLLVPQILGWRTWILYGNHEAAAMSRRSRDLSFVKPLDISSHAPRSERNLGRDDPAYGRARDEAYGNLAHGEMCPDPSAQLSAATASEATDGGLFSTENKCSMYNLLNDNLLGMVRWGPPITRGSLPSDRELPADHAATLFVHGGINLLWLTKLLQDGEPSRGPRPDMTKINEKITHHMRSLARDPNSQRVMYSSASPLENRQLTVSTARRVCDEFLPPILEYFGVARIVVGHTPQGNSLHNTRCGDRLIMADAIMSRWMDPSLPEDDTDQLLSTPQALYMQAESGSILSSLTSLFAGRSEFPIHYPAMFPRSTSVLGKREREDEVVTGKFLARSHSTKDNMVREARVGDVTGIISPLHADTRSKTALDLMRLLGVGDLAQVVECPSHTARCMFIRVRCMDVLEKELMHVHPEFSHYLTDMLKDTLSIVEFANSKGYLLSIEKEVDLLRSFCISYEAIPFLAIWGGVTHAPPHDEAHEALRNEELAFVTKTVNKLISAIER